MPKMKPHSGARKRIKITGSGKLRHNKANKGHAMAAKNGRRVRRLDVGGTVDGADRYRVRKLLGL